MSENNNSEIEAAKKSESEKVPEKRENHVKDLFILAALYLPLGFFLWFYFGSVVIRPTALMTDLVMSNLFPSLIDGVVQMGYHLDIETNVPLEQLVQGRVGLLTFTVNPMIYAYGVPLFFGLVLATPMLTAVQRTVQLLIGYAVLTSVQVWGVMWESLKDLLFKFGPLAAQAVEDTGLPSEFIALMYQLSYLILPALAPVVLWVLLNREFLVRITRPMSRRMAKR